MVKFIIGRAGSGKTHRVISQIKEAEGEIILLVPEQYSYATERLLCSVGGENISGKAEVLNFKRLSDRIFMFAGGYANKAVDGGARVLLMHRATTAVKPELKALSNMALRPEFLQSIIDMVEEIKTCSVSYEKLFNIGQGTLGDKLHDIALIAAAYDGQFENGKLDPADRMALATERAKTSGFFRGKKIWIDGYTGFSKQEFELLRVALAQCEECTISLCLNDDPEGENGAFSDAWETYATLSRMAGECEITRLLPGARYNNKALSHLEANLFLPADGMDNHEGIELYEASGAYNECEIAAAKIKELIRGGMRYRDIAVVSRNFDEYANILSAVFDRYGVPIYENTKKRVLTLAPTAFIINALWAISEKFRYDHMISYLKTGLSGVRRGTLDVLEQYLYTWHIEGKEWTSGEDFIKNPSGRNEEMRESDAEKLAFINRLRKKVCTPLLNLRDNIRKDNTGEGYAKALFSFFGEVKLARRLEARTKLYRIHGDISRAEQYEKIWNLLISAIESLSVALADVKFTTREFARMLSLVLSQYEIGTIPTALDRVNVGGFERLGEAPVKCVIILGAVDGRLPMYSAGKGILSDSEREKLEDLGIKLYANADRRLNDEFKLIYDAFTTASDRLIVIVPHTSADGKEARDSFVISRIRELFPGIEKCRFDMPELFAKAPCFDMAVSKSPHLWQSTAREYFRTDEKYSGKISVAERNAKIPRGPLLDRENIDALFGKNIRLSSGRTDSFNSCKYQYFLKYGLYLKPQKRATFDALEGGTFVHTVLEQSLKEIKNRGGHKAVTVEEVREIADAATEKYIDEKLGGFKARSARFCAQFKRLRRDARKVVENVHNELKESLFEPIDFELKFADRNGTLPALTVKGENYTVKVEGVVDRVDGCTLDDTLYIRVVDYKTGSKEFNIDEVLNGINMQMLIYLFTICELGGERYQKAPKAAGVLYLPANDPLCKLDGSVSEEQIAKENLKAVKRKGLLLNKGELYENEKFLPITVKKDGTLSGKALAGVEDFEKISKRIKGILAEIGEQLTKGEIDANPYFRGASHTACTYCEMKGACHFDTREGDELRDLYAVRLEDL